MWWWRFACPCLGGEIRLLLELGASDGDAFFDLGFGEAVVFELDADYQYAFVSGFNTDYLWLLAREPQVDAAIRARFLDRAEALGFDTTELIWLSEDL